jgi:hypothetical protein
MSRAALLTAVVCLSLPSLCRAAKVKVWNHNSPGQYDKARLHDAVISSEGAVRLSRRLQALARLDVAHVWDMIEDKAGNLWVATGDEGKIFKVTADGKTALAYTNDDGQVFCLALGGDGSIYAGTGPSGLLVRIPPSGKAEVVARSLGSYVWCLAADPAGETIYAGTGPKGAIYRVAADGKARVFYRTKQEHFLCLALGGDGMVYAGTDKDGLVYRIDARGKGFVLYQASQSEVRSLIVTGDGVYAGTSAPTKRRGVTGGGNAGSALSGPSARLSALKMSTAKGTKAAEEKKAASIHPSSSESSESTKASRAPAIAPPSSGENSLYRISPDGTVREIFREKAMLLSLLRDGGRFFIGTGMDGQLFEVHESSRERSEVARLDHGQIHRLLRRKDGSIVVGTGDPGMLYVLEDKYAARGTIVSEVLDAKIISRWGALRWKASTPKGTSVTVAVRSGNLAEPDETWSDWSDEQADGRQATVTAPPARFLQYRVTLTTTEVAVSPALRSLAIRYMTTNQAPEVSAIEVPDLDAVNLENPKKIKIKWTATDPNEDELTYTLYVRKEGWKSWVRLEEDYEKKEYEWDTTTTPSGTYQVKVVASDRKDNAAKDALTGEKISSPFVVSHTPPTVTVKVAGMDGEKVILEATATDPLVRLTSASFAVNGKKWTNVFPTDGLFDSKQETFRFRTEALKPGTYVVVLKVGDAAGNTGAGDIVFTVHARAAQR